MPGQEPRPLAVPHLSPDLSRNKCVPHGPARLDHRRVPSTGQAHSRCSGKEGFQDPRRGALA